MTHVRTQAREYFVARFAGLPTTGSNVFKSRVFPISEDHVPGVTVFCDNEQSADITKGNGGIVERQCSVFLEAWANGDDADDVLDQMSVEFETQINDRTLGGLAKDTALVETTFDRDGDNAPGFIGMRMEYRVTYNTHFSEPETAL